MDQQPGVLSRWEKGRAAFTPKPARGTSVVSMAPDVPLGPVGWHTGLCLTPQHSCFCSDTSADRKQHMKKRVLGIN